MSGNTSALIAASACSLGFAMVNFCKPGFMDFKKFKEVFARPILLGREATATAQQKKESQARSTAVCAVG